MTQNTANGHDNVAFMRDLENRYKVASGLLNRSQFKIFYGQVRPAPILTIGINTGGAPSNTDIDGAKHKDGKFAAASADYYENGESDLLDCNWPENQGLKKLLVPLLDGSEESIRRRIVKTNVAFRRSSKTTDIDIAAAKREAAPFLLEIISIVRPQLVLLTGVSLSVFVERFCSEKYNCIPRIRDEKIKHVVFEAANVLLRGSNSEALVVQVAHASQFSWTYEKYSVVERIQALMQSA